MAGKSGLGVLDVNHGVEYTKGSDCFHAHHMVWVLDCMIMSHYDITNLIELNLLVVALLFS